MINHAIILITFSGLFIYSIKRKELSQRFKEDWLIDALGLLIQGILIPLFQVSLSFYLFEKYIYSLKSVWNLNGVFSFLLHFIVIDYLYYWNHRLLHYPFFWKIHSVHHSSPNFDFFMTSRNVLWASFFIIYIWCNSFIVFLLSDPTYYLLSVACTAALDLIRHTKLNIYFPSPFISSIDHALHHASESVDINFGANLNIWDKIHGTYFRGTKFPKKFGIVQTLNIYQKLFFPFESRKK